MTINIYIISSDELKNRVNNINNVISVFKNLCNKKILKYYLLSIINTL